MSNDCFLIMLVRHGETEANAREEIQGTTDTPLTLKGKRQAADLARELSSYPVDIAYCSDLPRAKATCQILLATRGDVPVVYSESLCERR